VRKRHVCGLRCKAFKFTNRLDFRLNSWVGPNHRPYLCRREHTYFNPVLQSREDFGPWDIKDKKKTGAVILCMCLNIGVDPPGVQKTYPCAVKECWLDPSTLPSAVRAAEQIAGLAQAQFKRWAPRAEYKQLKDPTNTQLQRTCEQVRRRLDAKKDTALFYYNGHGCPEPTEKGEIWVFDADYTQYLPISIWDIFQWLNSPVLIFDCNNAGRLHQVFMDWFSRSRATDDNNFLSDTILLAACGKDERLPTHPALPADLFTACLTTPIKTSVVWYVTQHLCNETGSQARRRKKLNILTGITDEMIDSLFDEVVSGQITERKCPLGELNWVFTAITDTIAYEVLDQEMFQRLFRSDSALAPLLRNFLLADRIMASVNRTVCSYPKIPSTSKNPLWKAWDLAVENALNQMKIDFRAASGRRNAYIVHFAGGAVNSKLVREIEKIPRPLEINAQDYKNNKNIPARTVKILDVLHRELKKTDEGKPKRGRQRSEKVLMKNLSYLTLACVSGLGPQLRVSYETVLKSCGWNGTTFRKELKKHDLQQLFYSLQLIHDSQLKKQGGRIQRRNWVPLSFFKDQMTAFENWLDFGGLRDRKKPVQLPIVLQVVLSQQHRIRAIKLLCRFVDLGPWAIHKVLVIGLYPYVYKLVKGIKNPAPELRKGLTFLWGKIVALDPKKAQEDLTRTPQAVKFFLNHLRRSKSDEPEEQITVLFIFASIMHKNEKGRKLLTEQGLLDDIMKIFRSNDSQPRVLCWAVLCFAKLWEGDLAAGDRMHKMKLPEALVELLRHDNVMYRGCCVYALTCFLMPSSDVPGQPQFPPPEPKSPKPSLRSRKYREKLDLTIGKQVAKSFYDGSALVRLEVVHHLTKLLFNQLDDFYEVVLQFNLERQRNRRRKSKDLPNMRKSMSNPNFTKFASGMANKAVGAIGIVRQRSVPSLSSTGPRGEVKTGEQLASSMSSANLHHAGGTHSRGGATSATESPGLNSENGSHDSPSVGVPPSPALPAPSPQLAPASAPSNPHLPPTTSSQPTSAAGTPAEPSSTRSTSSEYEGEARRFIWRVVRVLGVDPVDEIRMAALDLIAFVEDHRPLSLSGSPMFNDSSPAPPNTRRHVRRSASADLSGEYRRPPRTATINNRGLLPAGKPPRRASADLLGLPMPRGNGHLRGGVLGSIPEPFPDKSPPTRGTRTIFTGIPRSNSAVSMPEIALPKTDLWRTPPPSRLFKWMCSSMLEPRQVNMSLSEDSIALELTSSFLQNAQRFPSLDLDRGSPQSSDGAPSIGLRSSHRGSGFGSWASGLLAPKVGSGAVSPGGYISSFFSGESQEADLVPNSGSFGHQSPSPFNTLATSGRRDRQDYALEYVRLSNDRHWRVFWSNRETRERLRERTYDDTGTTKFTTRRANFDTKAQSITSLKLHDHDPYLYAADCKNRIWIWDFEQPRKLNCFPARPSSVKGRITTIKLINQLHDSLLLTGSDDGQVVIWRNAHYQDGQTVIGGFFTERAEQRRRYRPESSPTDKASQLLGVKQRKDFSGGLHAVPKINFEWDQSSGILYTGGHTLRLYDVEAERFTQDIRMQDDYITAMTLDPTRTGSLVIGTARGALQFIDPRLKNPFAKVLKLHEHHIIRATVQNNVVHSIDPGGVFVVTDPRKAVSSGETIAKIQLKHSLNSFASHDSAPLIATGSMKQFVNLYSTSKLTEPFHVLHKIKFHEGFLGQRIGPVTHLDFHKQDKLLAVGGHDPYVSLYSPPTARLGTDL